MSDQYPVPAATIEVEEVIRRSRFVTRLGRATSREEAARFVQEARSRFPGATHHCWAFNAGAPGSTAQIGMSDDGEPRGTAGRPMLTVLLHSKIGEAVAVCTRYYGGVKLGTGGLARAYSGGVKLALEACPTIERVDREPVLVAVAYEAAERVRRALRGLDAIIEETRFGAEVCYHVFIRRGRRAELVAAVADLTAGRGVVSDAPASKSTDS